MKYALIEKKTGQVEAVILWDGETFFPIAEQFELIAIGEIICAPDGPIQTVLLHPPLNELPSITKNHMR